jgi:hypothetical protein
MLLSRSFASLNTIFKFGDFLSLRCRENSTSKEIAHATMVMGSDGLTILGM